MPRAHKWHKRGKSILFFICFFPFCLLGETHFSWIEARERGMGGGALALSSQYNPSSLLFVDDRMRCSASYENRYTLRELSSYSLGIHWGIRPLQMGFQFSRFGYEHYNETALRLYGACRLSRKIGLAARVQYTYLYYSREEGGDNFLSVDLFFTFMISKNWCIGMEVASMVKSGLNRYARTSLLPFSVGIGTSYLLSPAFILCFQAEFQDGKGMTFRGGGEYRAYQKFAFRAGFVSNPLKPTFGVGFRWNQHLRMDVASSYHRALGFSPTIGGVYTF